MTPICDICGRNLNQNEVKLLTGDVVWKATSNSYVPTNLPASWKVPGVNLASHWRNIVETNKAEDWGLCQRCSDEVTKFNLKSIPMKQNKLTMEEKKSLLTKAIDKFVATTDGNAFWAEAKKIAPRLEMIAIMKEIKKEAMTSANVNLIAAAMGFSTALELKYDDESWGNEYLVNEIQTKKVTSSPKQEKPVVSTSTQSNIPVKTDLTKIPKYKNNHVLVVWQQKNKNLSQDELLDILYDNVPEQRENAKKFPDGKLGVIQVSNISTYDWRGTLVQICGNEVLDPNKFYLRTIKIGTKDNSGIGNIYILYEIDHTATKTNTSLPENLTVAKKWWEFWK